MDYLRKGYFSCRQPESWEEAMLCGNGSLGAIVMGGTVSETIVFSHEKLFIPWKEKLPPVDSASHLDEIREMLFEGKFRQAAKFIVDLAGRAGYGDKRWTDPFFPACDLHIHMEQSGEETNYAHSLDFETGLAVVKWHDDRGEIVQEAFVSRADNIAVIKLHGRCKESISCKISLSQHPADTSETYWNGADKLNNGLGKPEMLAENGWLLYKGSFKKSSGGYGCITRVIPSGGTMYSEEDNVSVKDADSVIMLSRITPLEDSSSSCFENLKNELESVTADFDTLLSRHVALHKELFNRVSLELGGSSCIGRPAEDIWEESRTGAPRPEFFERIFNAGRYEILSSSGEWPPHLQGLWTGVYGVPWSSDYTQNGNVQTAIAGMLSGNTPECLDSYLKYIESLVPESRENARRLYNCRGILLASRTSTHGLNNHFCETWPMTFWTAGAAWAARFFYDYWQYTCDDSFFINRALPYMKEAALFYEDFLIEDAKGYWCFAPSYSPENNPINSSSQACINATMDIAAARELFGNLIEGCLTLGLEKENIEKWKYMLGKMPAYHINSDGAVKEWCFEGLVDRYDHRHASHLYTLFYGTPRELAENPPLCKAFAKAYELRFKQRKEEANVMAFGLIQIAMAAVHLGDAETTGIIMKQLAGRYYYRNFASSHDAGPDTFNADLSGGMPALIMESLVQSRIIQDEQGAISGYQIFILPVLPDKWKSGRVKGVLTRGGFIVDIEWENSTPKKVRIKNPHGKSCTLQYRDKEICLGNFVEKCLTSEDLTGQY